MSVASSTLTKQDAEQPGALVERLFRGEVVMLEMFSLYVGDRCLLL